MYTEEQLLFAYKYPFSKEAKLVVESQGAAGVDQSMERILGMAKSRLEEAFAKGRLEYKDLKYGKLDYVMAYGYARILVSGLNSSLGITKYVAAEAGRSKDAMENGSDDEIVRIANELGLDVTIDKHEFKIGFRIFLENMGHDSQLSNFRLHSGSVILDRHEMAGTLKNAIYKEIMRGLPIKQSMIPQRMLAFSKSIRPPVVTVKTSAKGGSLAWIDKLLQTPIPDVRHRVVNLVLAPYLINIKGMSEDDAFKTISGYIERCKELDPNTKINDSYIRYQCSYSKKKGLKPLSMARARELLGSFVDFGQTKEVVK